MTESAPTGPNSRDEQLYELIAEFHRRRDQGETIEPAQFASDHPEVQAELSRYFQDVAVLESMAGPRADESQPVVTETIITADTQNGAHTETVVEDSQTGPPNVRVTPDAPQSRFGRYRILTELGRGAMGAVYLAHDEQLDREVALKIPKFEADMNAELLERFYREARAAAALQHSGICPVFDVGELDGQHYITMAFIKGRPLRDFTKSSKRQKSKQVARVIRKIALAMAEAHEHNVTHRDLKPANIMINQKNEPVVMDFGLARRSAEGEERLTHTGTVIGTPAYMSPEQVDGDNENVGPRSDIYSLGVIFYEMLTGQLPFQGNLMSILKQIATTEPRPPIEIHADIDPSLQAICLSMMAKGIEDRPASMSDVARDLALWLQGRQVIADEAEPLETSRVSQQAPGNDDPTAPLSGDAATATVISDPQVTISRNPNQESARKSRKTLLYSSLLAGAAILLAGIAFFVQLGKVTVQITLDDPSLSLKVDDGDIVIEGEGEPIRLSAGTHKLQVERDGLEVVADKFVVKKDGQNAIRVAIVGESVMVLKNGEPVPATMSSVAAPPTHESVDSPLSVVELLTSPDYGWTEPANLGPNVNGDGPDGFPTLSADGLSLVFTSRAADDPVSRQYECQRKSIDAPWGPRKSLDSIDLEGNVHTTFLSEDGLTLLIGDYEDIWQSHRESRDASWQPAVKLGSTINTAEWERSARMSPDGLTLYFCRTPKRDSKVASTWRSRRNNAKASWEEPAFLGNITSHFFGVTPLADTGAFLFIRNRELMLGELETDGTYHARPIGAPLCNTFWLTDNGRALVFADRTPDQSYSDLSDLWMTRRVRRSSLPPSVDRVVSEWILAMGGKFYTDLDIENAVDEVPKGAFQITRISLDSCRQVTNESLKRFAGLKKLTRLEVNDTAVSNAGLVHLQPLSHLYALMIGNTDITDEGLAQLKGLVYLQELGLWQTRIGNTGIEHLKELRELRRLNLNDTAIGDAGLKKITDQFPKLKILSLANTNVTDAGIKHLEKLIALNSLELADTAVSDAGLRSLKGLTKLSSIRLENTQTTTAAIHELQEALPNCEIEWGGNASNAPPPVVAPFDTEQAKAHQQAWAEYLGVPVVTTNSIDMKLVVIPPGRFKMGHGEKPVDVTLTTPFRFGIHEVTQGQFKAVMGTEPWNGNNSVKADNGSPATYVDWDDATNFCRKLTEQEQSAGRLSNDSRYRLPTEAEWEFACRAGTTTRYSFGSTPESIDSYAWYASNTKDVEEAYPHAVGLKLPNGWGLYDMHGNVWEWCSDWHNDDLSGGTDPMGPTEGSARVNRGGAWGSNVPGCMSANRGPHLPSGRGNYLGFRVVLSTVAKNAPSPAVAPFDADQAKAHQQAWADYLGVPVEKDAELPGGAVMKFLLVPPGEFAMGSIESDREKFVANARADGDQFSFEKRIPAEAPQHQVTISQPFYVGKFEVTQGQWQSVTGENPSRFVGNRSRPVESVSWSDIQSFLRKVNGETSNARFGLPTEAQWEYACRAGTTTPYHFDGGREELIEYAWFDVNANDTTHPVGLRLPNPWGLHDMHGNVREWCSDWYSAEYYTTSPPLDPSGPEQGTMRVDRGGIWRNHARYCRSAERGFALPNDRGEHRGFRLALTVESARLNKVSPFAWKVPEQVSPLRKYPQGPAGLVGTMSGHSRFIQGVGFSPDGKQILSSSWNSKLRLHDVESGEEVKYKNTQAPPGALAVDAAFQSILTAGGRDGAAILWDLDTGLEKRRFPGKVQVNWLALSPDGKLAAIARPSGLSVWNTETGDPVHEKLGTHSVGPRFVEFSADGQRIVASAGETLSVFNATTGERLATTNAGVLFAVRFAADDNLLVGGGNEGDVVVWNSTTLEEECRLSGHSGRICSVAVNQPGQMVVTGSADRSIRVWDLGQQKQIHQFDARTFNSVNVAVSPDGRYVISGGGAVPPQGNPADSDYKLHLWKLPEF